MQPAHPPGSCRAKGYDRVNFTNGVLDLQPGSARQVANALEDGVVRGIWLTNVYGGPAYVVLAQVESLMVWTPQSMAVSDDDDALYRLTGAED